MLKKIRYIYKNIFCKIVPTDQKIIRSSGLIRILEFIGNAGLVTLFQKKIFDKRISGKIKFPLSNILISILLFILDGEKRISHYRTNPNADFFNKLFCGEIPDSSTILKALKANRHLKYLIDKIALRYALNVLLQHCAKTGKRKIIIDVDQTGREIHGRQECVAKGYFANRSKGTRGFQIRIWTIRELKIILKTDLLPGSHHSQTGTGKDLRFILNTLKKANIQAVFVADSGFNSGENCRLIESYGHFFILSEAQKKVVRRRGKYAKNKKFIQKRTIILKESKHPKTTKYDGQYREIFVKVLSPDGQYFFDFAADEFTNILLTNLPNKSEVVYRLYRKHAEVETVIEEIKNNFGAGIAHSNDFNVNNIMTKLTAISYNIKNEFIKANKMHIRDKQIMKLNTFQSRFIHTPGIFVNRANKNFLKIPRQRFKLFDYAA